MLLNKVRPSRLPVATGHQGPGICAGDAQFHGGLHGKVGKIEEGHSFMRYLRFPFLRRFVREDRGQAAAVILMVMFSLLALSAAGIETGHVYYAQRLLQASTNAAALSAAQAMPDIGTSGDSMTAGTAWGNMKRYSSIPSALNATNLLTGGTITGTFTCNTTTVTTKLSVSCQTPTGTGSTCSAGFTTCNQVAVTQTATVPLWFGGLVGMPSMTLSTSATAAMRGGTNIPYNIAVIIDTTGSMASCTGGGDGHGGGGGTNLCTKDCPNGANSEIACAVQGLQVMLENMDPCALNTTCTSTTAYVDSVALYVFPAIKEYTNASGQTTSYASDDTACPTTNPPIVPYSFENWTGSNSTSNLFLPNPGSTYIPTNAGTYQVVSWDNGYRVNDLKATLLNANDPLGLPNAVAYNATGTSCDGLKAPGGEGTYYAQVIYAAQSALVLEQNNNPGSQNVMIILSDGDATACNAQVSTGVTATYGTPGCAKTEILADNCPTITTANGAITSAMPCVSPYTGQPLNGTSATVSSGTIQPAGYLSYTYPSALGTCGQAVVAAQAATKAGTMVYTVAMGSEVTSDSSDCATDRSIGGHSYTASTGTTYGAVAWPSAFASGVAAGSPCNAIGAMASNANTFYSDDTNGCAATNNATFTTMAQIFQAIGNGLTASRLIPPGT